MLRRSTAFMGWWPVMMMCWFRNPSERISTLSRAASRTWRYSRTSSFDPVKAILLTGPRAVERAMPQDRVVEPVASMVLLDIELAGLLAAPVEPAEVAIHVHGARIDKSFDPRVPGGLEEDHGPPHVLLNGLH